MTDRDELLRDYIAAAGQLIEKALNDLDKEKRDLVAQALGTGMSHIRLITVMSPVIIVGALHHTYDSTVPPVPLFRVGDPGPEGDPLPPEEEDFH